MNEPTATKRDYVVITGVLLGTIEKILSRTSDEETERIARDALRRMASDYGIKVES